MSNHPKLTLVIPALNEEKNISSAIDNSYRACKKLGISCEVIVVDDGSRDRTPAILKALKRKYSTLKIVSHKEPAGIGGAFLAGARRAQGDAVVMIPGDNENSPEDILRFFGLIEQVDIIVPFVHNAELRNRWRRIISSLYRFIISFSFGTTLNYYNGTVIYRTRLVQALNIRSRGFFYQAEILIRALRRGVMFAEVPVLLRNRTHGKSKAISLKSLWGVMVNFLHLFWEIHFLRVETR